MIEKTESTKAVNQRSASKNVQKHGRIGETLSKYEIPVCQNSRQIIQWPVNDNK